MMKTRTAAVASAFALTAATTVAVAPAHAGPAAPAPETGVVHYQDTTGSGSAEGSLENPIIGAALVLLVGVGVSAALAVGAGVAGGAFELPEIPGLPF